MYLGLLYYLARIKLRVLADRQLMPFENFIDDRCICDGVFCVIDLFTDTITFYNQLEVTYYIK